MLTLTEPTLPQPVPYPFQLRHSPMKVYPWSKIVLPFKVPLAIVIIVEGSILFSTLFSIQVSKAQVQVVVLVAVL